MKPGDKFNWEEIFKNAHESIPSSSNQKNICIRISNLKPGTDRGARNVYQDDKDEIHEYAQKYGFVQLSGSTKHSVCFIKKR